MNSVDDLEGLEGKVGLPLLEAQALSISATDLERYLSLSGDRSAIHRHDDADNAIVPGMLLLAKMPALLQTAVAIEPPLMALTTALKRVQFRNTVRVGDTLQFNALLQRCQRRDGRYWLEYQIRLQDDNKPVLDAVMQDVVLLPD